MYPYPTSTSRSVRTSTSLHGGRSVNGVLPSIPSDIQVVGRSPQHMYGPVDPQHVFDPRYSLAGNLLDPRLPWNTYNPMIHPEEIARQRAIAYVSQHSNMISPEGYMPPGHHVSIHDAPSAGASVTSHHSRMSHRVSRSPTPVSWANGHVPQVESVRSQFSSPSTSAPSDELHAATRGSHHSVHSTGWIPPVSPASQPGSTSISSDDPNAVSRGSHHSVHLAGWASHVHPTSFHGSVHPLSNGYPPVSQSGNISHGELSDDSDGFIPPIDPVPTFTHVPVPMAFHPPAQDPFASSRGLTPTVLQTEKKLAFPAFDGKNPAFLEWFMKVQNQLMKTNQDYLLLEESTNALNYRDSKAAAIELFDKLTGSAHQMFKSLKNHRHFVLGGRGIEMLQELTKKFNPLDMDTVGALVTELQSLVLHDYEDLAVLINKADDICCRLEQVNQNPPESFMVMHLQNILKTSRYGPDLVVLLRTHAANKTTFRSIDELVVALHRMDQVNGRDYGGQAIASEPKVKFAAGTTNGSNNKTSSMSREQFVSSALSAGGTDANGTNLQSSGTGTLTHDWLGARELTEEQIKIVRANQQCHLCRTDKHPWTRCSKLLAKFDIIKKELPTKENDKDKDGLKKTTDEKEKGKASAVSTPLPAIASSTSSNRFAALTSDDEA